MQSTHRPSRRSSGLTQRSRLPELRYLRMRLEIRVQASKERSRPFGDDQDNDSDEKDDKWDQVMFKLHG